VSSRLASATYPDPISKHQKPNQNNKSKKKRKKKKKESIRIDNFERIGVEQMPFSQGTWLAIQRRGPTLHWELTVIHGHSS
jgi:hypothetical protein